MQEAASIAEVGLTVNDGLEVSLEVSRAIAQLVFLLLVSVALPEVVFLLPVDRRPTVHAIVVTLLPIEQLVVLVVQEFKAGYHCPGLECPYGHLGVGEFAVIGTLEYLGVALEGVVVCLEDGLALLHVESDSEQHSRLIATLHLFIGLEQHLTPTH